MTDHRKTELPHGPPDELAWRDRVRRLLFVLDSIGAGEWDFDLGDLTAFRTPQHDRIFGYRTPPPRWTVETFFDHVLPEDRAAVIDKMETAFDTKGEVDFECRIRRQDGIVRWIWCRGRHRDDERGRPPRLAGVVIDITERKQIELQARAAAEQMRALSIYNEKLREEERREMAREVHDGLGQLLTAVAMENHLLAKVVKELPSPARQSAETSIANLRALVAESIDKVRTLAADLRPATLDHFGLAAALATEATRVAKRTGIKVRVSVPPEELPMPAAAATAAFRIFQECMTNTVRHAGASRISVRLGAEDNQCVLTVADNGCGISAKRLSDPCALGLLGMRERAHAVGGTLCIASGRRGGTVVTLRTPLGSQTSRESDDAAAASAAAAPRSGSTTGE